jgi:hypothetical protein
VNSRDLEAEIYRLRISSPGYQAALATRIKLESDLAKLRANRKPKKKTAKGGVDHEASAHHAVKTAHGLLKSVLEKMDQHHEDYVDLDPTGKPVAGRIASTIPSARVRPTPVSDRIWPSSRRPNYNGFTLDEVRARRSKYSGAAEDLRGARPGHRR